MRISSSMSALNTLAGKFLHLSGSPMRRAHPSLHQRPLLHELAWGFAPYLAVLVLLLLSGV